MVYVSSGNSPEFWRRGRIFKAFIDTLVFWEKGRTTKSMEMVRNRAISDIGDRLYIRME